MSSSSHAHDAAHAADAHDHDFDGEPARDIPSDEPRTPGWLPAVGAAFFVCAAVYMLAGAKDDKAPPAQAPVAAAPPAPAPPPAPPALPKPHQLAGPPAAAGSGTARRMPEGAELERLKKLIEAAKKRKAAAPAASGHP